MILRISDELDLLEQGAAVRALKRPPRLWFPPEAHLVTVDRCVPDCHSRGGKRQHLGRLAPVPSAVAAFVREQGVGRFRLECRGRDGRILAGGAASLERAEGDAFPRLVDARTPSSYDRAPSPARQESQENRRLRREARTARKALRASLRVGNGVADKVVEIDRVLSELEPTLDAVKLQQAHAQQQTERWEKRLAALESQVSSECRAFEGDLTSKLVSLTETVNGLTEAWSAAQDELQSVRAQAARQEAELTRLTEEVAALTRALAEVQTIAAASVPPATPASPRRGESAPKTRAAIRSQAVAVPIVIEPPPSRPANAAALRPAGAPLPPSDGRLDASSAAFAEIDRFLRGHKPYGHR